MSRSKPPKHGGILQDEVRELPDPLATQRSVILTTNRNVASWETSSQRPPSPPPSSTGSYTEASCSPSPATATGSAPAKHKPKNTDPKEATTRLSNPQRWGISMTNSGDFH